MDVDCCRAGGVAEECDSVWIPAEGGDIRFDPLECETLVEDAEVLGGEAGGVGEAEDVCAVAVTGNIRVSRREDILL